MKKLAKILTMALVGAFVVSVFTACGGSKSEDKLVMATNATFPPYEYVDGDAYKGIDVEVAQAIADKLGMELDIRDVEFGSIIAGVQSGKFDMGMAGMTVTDERAKQVDFSNPYTKSIQVVITKA